MRERPNVLLLVLVMLVCTNVALAQADLPRPYSNPPILDFSLQRSSKPVIVPSADCPGFASAPSAFKIVGDEVQLTLTAKWTNPDDTSIFNPIADPSQGEPRRDRLKLRSYNGCLVGAAISIAPSQTLRLTLRNELGQNAGTEPANCPPDSIDPHDPAVLHRTPNCFDVTNVHTHGLHVSPDGNSDNVYLELKPGQTFQYEHNIPADHPSGTFWYHSHRHGSTAIEVASGMAGALIVRGNRTIEDKRAGRAAIADIDTILKRNSTAPIDEQILVFEQLSYACFDPGGAILTRSEDKRWRCDASTVGEVRDYGQFGAPGSWDASGRFTAINGEVLPRMGVVTPIYAGELQRWRMIHAGIRDAVNVRIVKVDPTAAYIRVQSVTKALPPATQNLIGRLPSSVQSSDLQSRLRGLLESAASGRDDLNVQTRRTLVGAICGDTAIKQAEFAADGLTRDHVIEKDVNFLQPGYRSDALVTFPDAGLFCILDASVKGDGRPTTAVPGEGKSTKPQRLLATVWVTPSRTGATSLGNGYLQFVLDHVLKTNPKLPKDVRDRIAKNDFSDYSFTSDLSHPVATKNVQFELCGIPGLPVPLGCPAATTPPTVLFGWDAGDGKGFQQFLPNTFPFQANVDTVESWNLSSDVGHIFHIHVNPFRIDDIIGTNGRSIFEPDGECSKATSDGTGDSAVLQYCDQKGIYRDTIFLISSQYTVKTTTRYERYIGEFVLHCHILDHEDQGMMAGVRILPPGGGPINAQTSAASHILHEK